MFIKPLTPQKLKATTINLGASFIKLAQVLATRADFFSNDYLEELKTLHDQLPAMKEKDFKEIFNKSFKENCFKYFDETPMASASIGQVHIAFLEDDTKVAVKLRRKGIKKQVEADIKIISLFNAIFKPLFSYYTKNSIEAVIDQFSSMILQEVSLNHELSNLKEFSSKYKDCGIKFPLAYENYCSDDALVMSFEEGFRFDDKENLLKQNIDFNNIISKLVDFYTTQMLINGYFHADPHPGNLLVNKKGELILLDFGMVKKIGNNTRIAIIELIQGANTQDYELYINATKKLGIITYDAPVEDLALFTQKMFEIFSNDNLNSESMQKLAFEVLETTKNLPFKLPSDAIYILRVSAIIEGLGTTYIENFNGVKDILPILQQNMPKALNLDDNLPKLILNELKSIPSTLKDLKSLIKQTNAGELEIKISKNQMDFLKKELKEFIKPIILSFTLLFTSIFLLLYDKNLKEIALILFGLGVIKLIYK